MTCRSQLISEFVTLTFSWISGDDERRRFFVQRSWWAFANDQQRPQRRCDETILRGPRAFECVCETAWLDLKRRGKSIKRENLLVDILTFDGFFGAEFDILKPRGS